MVRRIDDKTIEYAKKIVSENRVLNAVKYATSKMWFVEILDRNQLFDVYLDTTGHGQDTCMCDAFSTKKYCVHTVSAELYLNMKGIQRYIKTTETALPFDDISYKQTKTMLLTQKMKKRLPTFVESTQAETEYAHVDVQLFIREDKKSWATSVYTLQVGLKVGLSKLYVVQDLRQFLESYDEHQSTTLGLYEEIDWSVHRVKPDVEQLFYFLKQLLSREDSYKKLRYISIPNMLVQELLNSVKMIESVSVVLEGVGAIEYREETRPIQVAFYPDEQGMSMQVPHTMLRQLSPLPLLLVDDTMYMLPLKYVPIFEEVLPLLIDATRQPIHIPSDEIAEFLTYTLPIFQKIISVNIDALPPIETVESKLRLYAHYEKPVISIQLERNTATQIYRQERVASVYAIERLLKKEQFLQVDQTHYQKEVLATQDVYAFLTKIVPQLQKNGTVILDESLQHVVADPLNDVVVAVSEMGNLLDISFDIDGILQSDIEKILRHIQANESFYELSNGQLLDLEDPSLEKVHHVLAGLRGGYHIRDGHVQVHRTRALTMPTALSLEMPEHIQQMMHDLAHPELFDAKLPKTLQTTLKPYQEYGFKWLKMLAHHQLGGVLADDMGLGKTVQTIAYILSAFEENALDNQQVLIVCPASLVFNWLHEFEQFAPNLTVGVVSGTKKQREVLIAQDNKVVITSYQAFRQDEAVYSKKIWHTIVLDESQMVKNYSTKMHRSLRDIQAKVFFALSGTPVENRKEDFWSVFALVLPGLFPDVKAYRQLDETIIAKMAQPFVLRRLKKDVLHELPDKIETERYSELSKEQKTVYVGYLQRMQQMVSQYSSQEMAQHRVEILSGLTRLRQICCHPGLFVPDYTGDVGKLEQFLDMVDTAVENGHRILVFSQFAQMLDILNHALLERGHGAFQLTGKTPVKERMELVDRFNQKEKNIFLISLRAGGTGLNLTSADTIILYDLWWNPAVEEQATSRAHRIGQERTVQVYRLISSGTIEEKILQLQMRKKEMFDQMIVNESDEIFKRQQLSDDDIREILGLSDVTLSSQN